MKIEMSSGRLWELELRDIDLNRLIADKSRQLAENGVHHGPLHQIWVEYPEGHPPKIMFHFGGPSGSFQTSVEGDDIEKYIIPAT